MIRLRWVQLKRYFQEMMKNVEFYVDSSCEEDYEEKNDLSKL